MSAVGISLALAADRGQAGDVVEVAALIVGALGLVLKGLGARREKVKDDQAAVRGLVGMFDKLLVWEDAGHGYPLTEAVHLFRVYAPENAEALERVFDERRVFVRNLVYNLRARHAGAGQQGLLDLLDEAAQSEDLLRQATEMLRAYLKEKVPLEAFTGANARWVKKHL
jgi:hypothetical protein